MLVALGAAGLFGWILVVPSLLMPVEAFPALSFTEALGIFALGTGLVGLGAGHRGAIAVGGAAAFLLGGITLAGLAGPWLGTGPDREAALFSVGGYAPVRLPVSSAILLLFAGGGLGSLALRVRRDFGRLLAGLLGAVVVVFFLGVVVIRAVWLTELEGMLLVGSSLQLLATALPAGVCIVYTAWSADPPATLSTLRVPLSLGVACLVTALFLWRTIDSYERSQIRRQTVMAARTALREIYAQAETATRALSRIARFSPIPQPASRGWANGILALTRDIDGLRGIAWTDAAARVREFRPTPIPSDTAHLDLQRRLATSVANRSTTSQHELSYFALGDSGLSFAAAVPVCDAQACRGYIVGVFDAPRLMDPIFLRRDQGYAFYVSQGTRRLLGPRQINQSLIRWVERSSFSLGDVTWDLAVWPVADQLRQARTRLPDLLLLLGLLVSALLPVTVRLGQINWIRARLAERVRLNLALETSTDSIWEWNVESGAATRGEALWRHLGYSLEEAVGTMNEWLDLIHPDDQRRVTTALTDHLSGRTPTFEHHYRIRDRAGDWHWLIDRGRVVERASNGTALRVLGISADITERKRADESREASERRFRACFDSAYQGQILLDLTGHVLEANRTACELLGVESETLSGARLWEGSWWRAPAGHRAGLREAFAAALSGRPVRYETDLHGADGRPFVIDLSFSPIHDGAGRIGQLLLEWRDITERKRAEHTLREVESLSTMGRLAARVAHEINNPLAGIQNAFRLIKDAVPDNHPHRPYVGAIEREISRIAGVTRQLYETYRPERDTSAETDVGGLISDAVSMLEQLNRDSGVRIVADVSRAPPLVPLPDALVRQAVYNLVQNAVEASPPSGTVSVEAVVEDETFVLRVRDQGPGVPQEIRDRIFDPFFTTKSASVRTGGMGLGLSLVHRSVHAFGGRVEFVDLPAGGTEFVVRLPLTPTAPGVPA